MLFGVYQFLTDETIGPVELAGALEEHGFESLFVPEHTHIPVSRRTPYPAGGPLPREYSRTLDPFVALTAAATITERLRVGTGVCLVVERDPIVLAKQVASLDRVSGGRMLFGVGAGWNAEEMADHGTDPSKRFALLRERVLAMKAIWTDDEAAFDGEFVSFEPMWSWPKPTTRPHPPVIIGGNGPSVLDRVLDYGDEWMPIFGRGMEQHLAGRIDELRSRAADAGRGRIPVTLYGASSKPEAIEAYQAMGVDRCLFWSPPAPAAEVLERIGRIGKTISQF